MIDNKIMTANDVKIFDWMLFKSFDSFKMITRRVLLRPISLDNDCHFFVFAQIFLIVYSFGYSVQFKIVNMMNFYNYLIIIRYI